MGIYKRKVCVVGLSDGVMSKSLTELLIKLYPADFEHNINITHFAPPVPGRYDGRPENCYPAEEAELEMEPMFDLDFEFDSLWGGLINHLRVYRDDRCYNNVFSYAKWFSFYTASRILLERHKQALRIEFKQTTKDWIESEKAYKEVIAAILNDFDPED